jgi:large subunit ribosomal protein L22
MATAKKKAAADTQPEAKKAPAKKAVTKKPVAKKSEGAQVARAILNRVRISPTKLNYVAGLIRGMNVGNALTQLAFSNKRIARDVRKAVQSAVANAENNFNMNVDDLIVAEAWVGKGIVMKRMHTRARGRGARILKPFSNLTIILREKGE